MTDDVLFEKTRKLLYENMIKGYNRDHKVHFHYTKPSPGTYPFQFFWDTCFHVFILSALGEQDMAKEHLVSLFALQEEDGFVGHMIYWERKMPGRITDLFQSKPRWGRNLFQSHMSALIQPPLAAQAVHCVYEATEDKQFLHKMLPKLKKYYHWLAKNRDFDGDHLLTIISPFESGIDWKPSYDVPLGFPGKKADWRLFLKVVGVDLQNYLNNYQLRKIYDEGCFLVKDAGFNAIYAQNLVIMKKLCQELDDPGAAHFGELAEKVIEQLCTIMYNEEDAAFYDVYGKNNKKINIVTPTIFYPLFVEGMPEEIGKKVMEKHFFNGGEFDTPFPIPSVAKNHPSFNPKESIYIWRGPTWIVYNWFMHWFLMEKGFLSEADKLLNTTKELIAKSGFREYYNPFTGEGYGAENFTWAGLIVDMIKRRENT